jgi:hypothetical protein
MVVSSVMRLTESTPRTGKDSHSPSPAFGGQSLSETRMTLISIPPPTNLAVGCAAFHQSSSGPTEGISMSIPDKLTRAMARDSPGTPETAWRMTPASGAETRNSQQPHSSRGAVSGRSPRSVVVDVQLMRDRSTPRRIVIRIVRGSVWLTFLRFTGANRDTKKYRTLEAATQRFATASWAAVPCWRSQAGPEQ